LARGIIRDAVTQYNVDDIVTSKRAELEQRITEQLNSALGANDLVLVDFVLRNIRFSAEYAAAVEQKQVAAQQAQEAALVIERKQQEAEQARVTAQGQADAVVIGAQGKSQATVLQAQADAQAASLVASALNGARDLLTFRYIDQLSPNAKVSYLPSGNSNLVPVPAPTGMPSTTPLTATATITPTTPP
jgi:regulator of protease activity HflC (stomatin/prohibitin superfamily)